MIEFLLPGVMSAVVFFAIIMSCPFRYWLLKFHWYIDFCFTGIMFLLFSGTYAGAMTACVGGAMLTILMFGTWYWFFEPIPIRKSHGQP